MSKSLGAILPQDLLTKLTGGRLYRSGGLGLPVLTVDSAGWPHVALAPGAVAVAPDTVYVAMGGTSGSLQNALRSGRVTLLVAGPETLYYVKGEPELVRAQMQIIPQEAAVRIRVTEVLEDMETFLTITGGVSYRYRVSHDDSIIVINALLDELLALAEDE